MPFRTLGQFWMNLPVSIKGPLTICIPVASTVFFAVVLWSLEPQLERAQELVLHVTRVQAGARRVLAASADLARVVDRWQITGNRQLLGDFSRGTEDLLASSTALVALAIDPAQHQDALGIDILVRSEIDSFQMEITRNPGPEPSGHAKAAIQAILDKDGRLAVIQLRLSRFLSGEERIINQRMARLNELNRSLRNALRRAAIAACCAAIVCAVLFSWTISRRLILLARDAEAAGRGAVVTGGGDALDEIGRASREIRRNSKALAERERSLALSQEGLAQAVERFDLAVRGSNDGIWDWDLSSNFVYYSGRCAEMLGCTIADMKGDPNSWTGRILEEDRALVLEPVRKCLEGEIESFQCEYRMRRFDGRIVWIYGRATACRSGDGTTYRMTGFLTDITRRKEAEDNMQREHGLLEAVVEGTSDVIYIKDKDLRYIKINSACESFLGVQKSAAIGRRMHEIVSQESAAKVTEHELRVLATGQWDAVEHVIQVRGGAKSIWLANRGPWRDSSGTIIGIIGISRDITELKLTEERIRASLVEKEVLLKEIHHRVKNNLQVISGLLYLKSENVDLPEVKEALQESRGRVQSIALIHEQLYKAADLAQVDFAEYFAPWKEHAMELLGADPKRIRVECDIDPVLLAVEQAIPCALIMNELVSNAVKYAFPGTRQGRVEVQLKIIQNGCRLSVADDGVGLPAGCNLEQTPSLGLHLVGILTRQLKGVATIDRSAGTRIQVQFPIRNEVKKVA
jgi:PAS domain S-box-containing protein